MFLIFVPASLTSSHPSSADKTLSAFPHYRFNPGNITPDVNYGFGVLKLFRNRLRTQIKQMPFNLFQFTLKLIPAYLSVMLRFHLKFSSYNKCLRLTNLHRIGIL